MHPHHTTNTPQKLCECGCGQYAPIAKITNSRWGHIKGLPVRFIRGHHVRLAPIRPTQTLEERFWQKVRKDGPVHPILGTRCWLWTASNLNGRYGQLKIGDRMIRAHRVSYELHYGPIPDGMKCLHHCDNGFCIRPDHLFLGTQADNVHDMIKKDRTPCIGKRGQANPKNRLKNRK